MPQTGLHHVTAIAGPARRNLAFYADTLGLRLVKRTVNFDDPGTWHLYYGDEAGSAGTILTFFPWEHATRGRPGIGEAQETAFRVPEGSLGYWTDRLAERGVRPEPARRFGESIIAFPDPDGTRLALVAVPGAEGEPAWTGGEVPAGHAIHGLHGVTLELAEAVPTAGILTGVLGFSEAGREGAVLRLRAAGATAGAVVDLRETGGSARGALGAGSVHHVAFRAANDAVQAAMVGRLAELHGIRTTEQKDRDYFRSVYFREPGGVLFEIATDIPGFAVDEPLETLGRDLRLPRFLEPRRREIEAALPAIS